MRVNGAAGRFMMKKRGNPKGQIEWRVEGEIWCLFMDTCCENRRRGGGTGGRGRTDKQMRFCVKSVTGGLDLEGMLPLWTNPALLSPVPCVWPLYPDLQPGLLPWQGGCLASLAQVRHLDQGRSLLPPPLESLGIIFLHTRSPGWKHGDKPGCVSNGVMQGWERLGRKLKDRWTRGRGRQKEKVRRSKCVVWEERGDRVKWREGGW